MPGAPAVRPVPGQGWCTTKVPAAPQTSVADPRTALMPVMIRGPSGPDGMVSGVHDVPFQCRTDVPSAAPAAQTLVGELAVTAVNWPPPPWFGTAVTDHAVPFQCAVSCRQLASMAGGPGTALKSA